MATTHSSPQSACQLPIENLQRDGFCILKNVISEGTCTQIINDIDAAMQKRDGDAIQAGQGRVVGGRNLLSVWDGWQEIVHHSSVNDLTQEILGESAGVVRILFFDKPPGKGWSLSMHKDRTIAVKEHCDPMSPFSKPTRKAGVPHVEATEELLGKMLTLRLHLDAMHQNNGPLVVVPGSHDGESNREIQTIQCDAGDVFVMRPLLSHGSLAANPSTNDHRRVVHIEMAPDASLPGAFRWHDYSRVRRVGNAA